MADEDDSITRDGALSGSFGTRSSFMEDKIQALLATNPMDFSSWTSLIMEIEKTSSDDIGIISRVYESFLSEFPLCYGYWEKYAAHKARLCSIDKVIEVYEEAVKSATYSVDVWANYCRFAMQFYEDFHDVRRLYERALTSVGKDYQCHILWDRCIAFEYSHKQWEHLVHIYIRSLRFPTKKIHSYYKSFKELVTIWMEEMKCQNIVMRPLESELTCELAELNTYSDRKVRSLVCDVFDQGVGLFKPKALGKISAIGEYFYKKSSYMDDKIGCFEAQIQRPYFHIKPLDDHQLQVWHHYLDFVELQGDFDWTVKLYERCLIPCANYPEFWVRYIEMMEVRGGREITNLALARASKSFLKRIPQFRYYYSKVKEQLGDDLGACTSLPNCHEDLSSNIVEEVNQRANMEKRLGNIGAACLVYEKAMEMVKEQDTQAFSLLCSHFARFTYVVTGDLDAAKGIFVRGISRAPYCRSLFEGLITFMTLHGSTRHISALDSIVGNAIVPEPGESPALSPRDCEKISNLFLEFVDLCGTVEEIRKAWARHLKLFPHAMRPCTSFSCSINHISVLGKTKEKNSLKSDNFEAGIVDPDKQSSFNDAESSKGNQDLLMDGLALAAKSYSEVASNSMNGNMEQVQPSENAKMHSECEAVEPPEDTDGLCHEASTLSPNVQSPFGCLEAEDQTQALPDWGSHDDLRPSLENLLISHPDNESRRSSQAATHDDNGIQSPSNGFDSHGRNEAEVPLEPSHNHTKSILPATLQSPADKNFIPNEQNLQQVEVNTLVQNHHPAQVPENNVNWHQVHGGQIFEHQSKFHGHVQAQQHQQWLVPVQLQHPNSGCNPQLATSQAYTWQPQFCQANTQTVNQLQGCYQMAPQIYPSGTIVWQAPNVQQNFMAGGQSQLVNQAVTQTHVYQQQLQRNEQRVYFQDGHGVSSQLWHYFQQQPCHAQHDRHDTQLRNPQHHQQQNGPHQPQQLQQNILQQWQQQDQQQNNILRPQEAQAQQQLPQLKHSSQPCQQNNLQESLHRQDSSEPRQNQQYVHHQAQQHHLPLNLQPEQDQFLPVHQEQQQQSFLQQQPQKQSTGSSDYSDF